MGGEWFFNFKLARKDSFDLKAYQTLLPKLKAEFEPMLKKAKDDFDVAWCSDEKLPPEDNIFARFTYECSRNHSSWGPDHPVWCLYWDPTIVSEEQSNSNIHGRCGPCFGVGAQLQRKIEKDFPDHFYYENDCANERDLEVYDDYDSSEPADFTACDKECGYCGKCPY